jgi:hypothetical protein
MIKSKSHKQILTSELVVLILEFGIKNFDIVILIMIKFRQH